MKNDKARKKQGQSYDPIDTKTKASFPTFATMS